MKKEYNHILTSPMTRTLVYLSVFAAGSVVYELLSHCINAPVWSNASIAQGLVVLAVFTLVGALFVCERHVLSRVTSAATLFVLGVIALKIGHTAISDSYLFALALGVAFIGAQNPFHRELTSRKRMILYSLIIVGATLVTAFAFVYGITVIDRIVMR